MELTLTTPAVLFPAISLLLLAYTNRFLHLANLIRQMHATELSPRIRRQIANLRRRVILIRYMQEAGVLSFLLCVLTMLALYVGSPTLAWWLFGLSLLLLGISLCLSVVEIRISVKALDIHLDEMG
ncbi:MAG: DUF2721 domain-containing protein [Pseudomonadota bacterium]|uniref:DUF2721 domain-containing protein n=1 Tax=Gallaecimonas pentaromativorans TaxID=584787 RepID=UPI00067EA21E|nr:DUF2721 domain-containing protein [Gallaecimonas pentaromativorans]MED5523240.1 DUF2721 domain-containing protein [Pseudomonadota bacterium]